MKKCFGYCVFVFLFICTVGNFSSDTFFKSKIKQEYRAGNRTRRERQKWPKRG